MATDEERQAYIDDMARRRGYVLAYHKGMAAADFEVLKAADALVGAVYTTQRRLEPQNQRTDQRIDLSAPRSPPCALARASCRAIYTPLWSMARRRRMCWKPSRLHCLRRVWSPFRLVSRPGARSLASPESSRMSRPSTLATRASARAESGYVETCDTWLRAHMMRYIRSRFGLPFRPSPSPKGRGASDRTVLTPSLLWERGLGMRSAAHAKSANGLGMIRSLTKRFGSPQQNIHNCPAVAYGWSMLAAQNVQRAWVSMDSLWVSG